MTDHVVTMSATSAPETVRLPFYFRATCSCHGFDSGYNAIKWVLLAVQDHYTKTGLTWTQGNLSDGHLLRDRIVEEIEGAAHPCQETDGAYCACADLQRKQDVAIAEAAHV